MSLYEIIDRERKRTFGFSDDRRCLFTFGDFRRLLMEIEDAAKREIPQPDSDWKTICEKCMDGDIFPDNCEYFGEPNGCNSPIYGEHPKEKRVNAAKMRKALERIVSLTNSLDENCAVDPVEIRDIARDALSESSVG